MAVEIETVGERLCPRCGHIFEGAGISASPEARILCPDCSMRTLDERREREKAGRYWWAAEGRSDGR